MALHRINVMARAGLRRPAALGIALLIGSATAIAADAVLDHVGPPGVVSVEVVDDGSSFVCHGTQKVETSGVVTEYDDGTTSASVDSNSVQAPPPTAADDQLTEADIEHWVDNTDPAAQGRCPQPGEGATP